MTERVQSLSMTDKQIKIMAVIVAGNGTDAAGVFDPVDLDQLLERLPYKTTKDSMQFSIRALMRRDMVEKGGLRVRDNRRRVIYLPTENGKKALGVGRAVGESYVLPPGVSELLETLE